MKKKCKKGMSVFMVFASSYALISVIACWWFRDRIDEAILSLLMFGMLTVVIAAWIVDALRYGEMWRQGPRSLTESLTMNQQKITRKDSPKSFWIMISLAFVFALAILAFVVTGIYVRLTIIH